MDRYIGRETFVVELDGRPVLPGFNDGHVHFLEGSLGLDLVHLEEAQSLEEMKDIIRAYARDEGADER